MPIHSIRQSPLFIRADGTRLHLRQDRTTLTFSADILNASCRLIVSYPLTSTDLFEALEEWEQTGNDVLTGDTATLTADNRSASFCLLHFDPSSTAEITCLSPLSNCHLPPLFGDADPSGIIEQPLVAPTDKPESPTPTLNLVRTIQSAIGGPNAEAATKALDDLVKSFSDQTAEFTSFLSDLAAVLKKSSSAFSS